MALKRHEQMTHYLKTFTELLPKQPDLEQVKADFLQKAETVGMTEFLRVRAISQRTIEREVKEQFSNFMTDAVAEIIVQRGLLDKDQIDLLGFVDEDPDDEFVAAVRDAVQVNFVYEAAREHHRMEAGYYDRALKNAGQKNEVQEFVKKLATSHPALVGPSTLHAVDEMIAELHASAPWMADVSTWTYKALRASYNTGQTWLALPPVILVGPPGCGKSTYARKLAALSGAPVRTLDAGASNASFIVAGTDPTWSKAQAGIPLQEVAKSGIANPVMIVDEIEKAGTMTTSGGSRVSLPDALLGLLEPTSSTSWECPYSRRSYNMSQISWILTANDREGIPAPLLDRCRVFDVGYPAAEDLAHLIRILAAGCLFDEVTDRLIARVQAAVSKGRPPSLRRIQQLIGEAVAVAHDPVLH